MSATALYVSYPNPSSSRRITTIGSLSPLHHFNPCSTKSCFFLGSINPLTLAVKPQPPRFHPTSIVMEWQDCTVRKELDVPASVAYNCYSDRESIPRWMPFISSVKILEDKPDVSQWSFKYSAFGQDLEFSWLARNLQPIPNQKIHWRSLQGLPNRGAVRFFPRGPSSCVVELTVSYEVPQLLVPVASALQPFLEGLLRRGLEQFATFAKNRKDSAV
ncbi:Coenzyme Q-binding protein COQ10, START domain [Dillenia turbinata]|uniref:Coenzyme Q-binding protein COQ10, START domain n=1 Tax=Dillenia turbinata TaxID=194707 RepID=A0AAN8W0L6_9MAGN